MEDREGLGLQLVQVEEVVYNGLQTDRPQALSSLYCLPHFNFLSVLDLKGSEDHPQPNLSSTALACFLMNHHFLQNFWSHFSLSYFLTSMQLS